MYGTTVRQFAAAACPPGYTGVSVTVCDRSSHADMSFKVQCDGNTFYDQTIGWASEYNTGVYRVPCNAVQWYASNTDWIWGLPYTVRVRANYPNGTNTWPDCVLHNRDADQSETALLRGALSSAKDGNGTKPLGRRDRD